MPNKMHRDPFVREVRAGLARNGHTQSDLATALSMSRNAITRRLGGEVPFDHTAVPVISKFLDTPIAKLFGEEAADKQEVSA